MLELFYSYSHKDEELRNELERHLQLLQRNGLIQGWHDRRISPGAEWADDIDLHIRSAQIVLLLISADFLASDYCYGEEMRIALERHEQQRAVVIPIILRPVDWAGAPFAKLQALPRDGKAITLWRNRDEAFSLVAREIREVVIALGRPALQPDSPGLLGVPSAHQERVLDAALPGHIGLNTPTELLVLIRLPESQGLQGILQADDETEAQPEDVRSKPFEIAFPVGPAGIPEPLKVTIEVTSPDFSPASQRKNVIVPIDGDSPVCSFVLRPLRLGQLMAIVELQWQDAQHGYRRLRTNCLAEVDRPADTPLHVARMPFLVGASAPVHTEASADFDTFTSSASVPAAPAPAAAVPAAPAPAASVPAGQASLPHSASVTLPRPKSSTFRYGGIAAALFAIAVVGTVGVSFFQPLASRRQPPASPPSNTPAIVERSPQAIMRPFSRRVLATVHVQAAGCQSAINPFDLQIPNSRGNARIELDQIAKDGNAGFRNIHVDPAAGRVTGELYAIGSGTQGPRKICLSPKPASASYHVIAVYP